MIRIALSAKQVRELERALRRTDDRKLHDRVQIVLMSHRGRSREQVAVDLGVTPRTVQRWLNAYLDRGLAGLRPRRAPGPTPRIAAALADEVRGWVIAGPAACGLPTVANWTHEALAAHLGRVHGIRVKRSAMHAFCRRHGIRPYRPTYRYLRGDATKQARAARELARLKKGRRAAN
jgi:transposase